MSVNRYCQITQQCLSLPAQRNALLYAELMSRQLHVLLIRVLNVNMHMIWVLHVVLTATMHYTPPCSIHVPRPMSIPDRGRGSSNGRRRAAIDISPTAVQRLAEKVATLEEHHYRTSLDGDDDSGVTRMEIEQLYTDLQLIHRGRYVAGDARLAAVCISLFCILNGVSKC